MSPNLKIPRLSVEIWLILAVIVAHGYAAVAPAGSLLNWFRSDDAFYYFKTAQNISEGYGITFDRLGRDGGFHPLWMAICVPIFALARLDLLLPLRMVVMLSALLNAASGILILRMTRRVLPPAAAAFAAFFFCFYPPIHSSIFQMGLESGLSAFSLALLLYSVMRAAEPPELDAAWLWKVGLCGALAVLARLDNIFVVAVLGAWLVLRPLHPPRPLRPLRPGPLQSERGRALALLDAALVAVGVLASFMWRVGFGVTFEGYALSEYVLLVLALAVRLAVYWALGLYPGLPGVVQMRLAGAARLLLAWALASALTGGLMLVLLSAGAVKAFPRLVLVYEAGLALFSLVGTRTLWWGWDAFLTRRGSTQAPAAEKPASPLPMLCAWASRSLALFAPTAAALALYITCYKLYFGTFSPVSGQIKRWWGTLPNTVYGRPTSSLAGLLGFAEKSGPWELAQNILRGPFQAVPGAAGLALTIFWAAACVGLVVYLGYTQRARIAAALAHLPVFPLGIGAFAQVISYTGTGYLHMRAWYWTAQMLFFTLLLAALFDAALSALSTRLRAPRAVQTAAACACLALVIALGFNLYDNLPYPSGDMSGSLEDVRDYYGITELEQRTPPGALIGSTGGGGIAYLIHDRTIVNLDGLMNTAEYFQALQEGSAAQYLDRLGLDYVFTGEYVITDSDPYFQFKGRLEKIANFGGAALFRWLPACKEEKCEF